MQDEVEEISLWKKNTKLMVYIYIYFNFLFFFLPITNFFRSALFLFCIECLAESIEKKGEKVLLWKERYGKISSE